MFSNIFIFMLLLSPFIAVISPRFLAFYPILIGVVIYSCVYFTDKKRILEHYDSSYLKIISVLMLLLLSSYFWAIDSDFAIERSLNVLFILLGGFLLWNSAKFVKLGKRDLSLFSTYYPFVIILLFIISYINQSMGLPLYKILRGMEFSEFVPPAKFNRSLIALMFLSVPAFYICWKLKKYLQGATMLILMIFVCNASESQSLTLGFGVGLIISILPLSYKWLRYLGASFIILMLAISPWLSIYMFDNITNNLIQYEFFKHAYAGERLEIWSYVSNYILINPLYGFGLEATRFIEDFETDMIFVQGNKILHPHNFALQIWIEFGATGIFIFSTLLLYIVNRINTTSIEHSKLYIIFMIMLISVLSASYGMWQSWLLGLIVLMLAVLRFALYCIDSKYTEEKK